MTTSRQPWTSEVSESSNKTWIKDADGKVIGVFDEWQDADMVLQWQNQAEELETAQEKLEEIQNVMNGEY